MISTTCLDITNANIIPLWTFWFQLQTQLSVKQLSSLQMSVELASLHNKIISKL